MSRILSRTAALGLLVPILAGCSTTPPQPIPGAAPYEAALRQAASSITPASVLERISVIADDSMGGRNTPSQGLEKTAAFFASKYQQWGLLPAGENGTYFQRYPLVKRAVDLAQSWVQSDENGTVTRYPLTEWGAVLSAGSGDGSGDAVIFAGALTPEAIGAVDLDGRVAVMVYDTARARDWNGWRSAIAAGHPTAMLMIRNDAAADWPRLQGALAGRQQRFQLDIGPSSGPPEIWVNDRIFANDPMNANRPDWASMRQAQGPVVQVVGAAVQLQIHVTENIAERTTAPNVVAMIPGSDPMLRNEYVVYSAHMDHIGTIGDGVGGCRAAPAKDGMPVDSICNGADDDGSGSTGVVMVAEAYSRLQVKPKRSILILNVSGEEKGLLGSRWFSEHPTVPESLIVADINMDMIGRNAHDSIVVIGKEHSDMGTTLARVNTRHPELNLTTADDIWPNERFYFRSDHFNFARKGVPILFFFNGVHDQYHRSDDEVGLIDTSKLARVATMAFYLGAEIANTVQRPQWNPESYKEIVGSTR